MMKTKPVNKKPKVSAKKFYQNKEIYWIAGVMIACLLILILFPYISKQFNSFKYQNLVFTKERFADINVYHHYYYFSDEKGQQYQYNLYLRNDPRKNNVSVEGEIT